MAASETTRVDFHLSTGALIIPPAAYVIAHERLGDPFPADAIDKRGARFLDRGAPVPPRHGSEPARPRPYIYSLTNRDIEVVYRGLGRDTASRAYEATVRREFRDATEERLLRIAEETYPPAKAVASIADVRDAKPSELLHEKRLWWYGGFDGVRLPYAVTMDAVRYYLGLTQAFGARDTARTRGIIRMKRSKFSYSARISPGPTRYSRGGHTFENVYVVEMKLSWSNYCGSLCACYFDLDRTVVLRTDGTIVWVFGDRKPMVVVS